MAESISGRWLNVVVDQKERVVVLGIIGRELWLEGIEEYV